MDFAFSIPDEIAQELGRRLRACRLAQAIQQRDLAQRAGVSVGTIKALEKTGQSTLLTVVRVAQALGRVDDLQSLFELQVRSIADMERVEQSRRQRAPRKPRTAASFS